MHFTYTNDSFTDSDQEAANTPLHDGSSLSAKNFNGMFDPETQPVIPGQRQHFKVVKAVTTKRKQVPSFRLPV